MKQCEAIVMHPYIERRKKYCIFLQNATIEGVEAFMTLLDIAEELCTCSDERFKKLLPIFKRFYFLAGDADTEIRFIKEQRKGEQL